MDKYENETPIEKAQPWFNVIMMVILCLGFLWIGRMQGEVTGAYKATEQILAAQTQSTEIVALRARLSEQRRGEESVTNAVFTTIAAAVGVLAVANLGLGLIGLLSLQREKDALRLLFVEEAKGMDLASENRLREAIRDVYTMSNEYMETARKLDVERITDSEKRLADLEATVREQGRNTSYLLAEQAAESGRDAFRRNDFVHAAERYTQAAAMSVPAGQDYAVSFYLERAFDSLEEADTAGLTIGHFTAELMREWINILSPNIPESERAAAAISKIFGKLDKLQRE